MVKGRIVVSSVVSDALVSGNAEQKAWGRHVLIRQLAAVAVMEVVEGCLPGTLLEPAGTGIDGWLYANVDGVLESYAASAIAAPVSGSDKVTPGLRERLVAVIDRMMMVVPRERLAYRDHGDLERLLGVTLPAIRNVLLASADLLGHCASTGEPPLDSENVVQIALDRAGLRAWFRVYRDDLARCHQRFGQWESTEEFLAFNIHAERLLIAVGMFAWEGPEGLRVEVPLDMSRWGRDYTRTKGLGHRPVLASRARSMAFRRSIREGEDKRQSGLLDWLSARLHELPSRLLATLVLGGLTAAFRRLNAAPWGSVVVDAAMEGIYVLFGGLAICYFALFLVGLRQLPGRWRAEKARQNAEEVQRKLLEGEAERNRAQEKLDRALTGVDFSYFRYCLSKQRGSSAEDFDLKNQLEALRERLLEVGIPVLPESLNSTQKYEALGGSISGSCRSGRKDYVLLKKFLDGAAAKNPVD